MNELQLMAHQKDVLQKTKDHHKVAYFLDMGLGKTFVGAEKMHRLDEKVNLLVCQKSKIQDWLEHFRAYYDFEVYDLRKDLKGFLESSGNRVGVINYDILHRREELKDLKNFTLMLDESSMVKNETAKRTKAVLGLKAKSVILLSGTPTGGKYEELWTQCRLLGWDISKELFFNTYTRFRWIDFGYGYQRFVYGYQNIERLKAKLAEHGAIFMKTEEVLTLPSQNFTTLRISPNKEYEKFLTNHFVQIEGRNLFGEAPLAKLLHSRELCGMYSKEKLQAFKDLIDSSGDRFIVFYNFTEELYRMVSMIGDRPYSVVNGKTVDLRSYENHENAITFVQYQAGAMGLNLQKANRVIYFTLPLSSELFEQSKKRIHRVGQEKPCFYYSLIVKDSVEEKIKKTLEMRQDYSEKLFSLGEPRGSKKD